MEAKVQEVSIKECLLEGWDAFKKHWLVLVGAYFLYLIIIYALNRIPIINFISAFLISPALVGGYMLVFLNTAKDNNPSVSDLFRGFNRYGTVMGVYYLLSIVLMFLITPSIIFIFKSVGASNPVIPKGMVELYTSPFFLKMIAFWYANIFLIIIIFVRFIFVLYIMMDDPKRRVMDCFSESNRLLKGNSLNFIVFIIISSLLTLAGFILLIIPGLIMGFVVGLGGVRFYLKLKEMHKVEVEQLPL